MGYAPSQKILSPCLGVLRLSHRLWQRQWWDHSWENHLWILSTWPSTAQSQISHLGSWTSPGNSESFLYPRPISVQLPPWLRNGDCIGCPHGLRWHLDRGGLALLLLLDLMSGFGTVDYDFMIHHLPNMGIHFSLLIRVVAKEPLVQDNLISTGFELIWCS